MLRAFRRQLKHLTEDLLALILPARCLECNELIRPPEYYICQNCLNKHPRHCNRRPNYFSLLEYSGTIQKLVWHLKYDSRPEIGDYLGSYLGEELKKAALLEDPHKFVIVPVPLHPKRQRKRGYNQSDRLALGLASALNCTSDDKLVSRNTNNVSQTTLNKNERGKNVQNIFAFCKEISADKTFLIIDDVITTGATTRELLKLFKEHNYSRVIAISLAAPAIGEFDES